MSEDFKAFLDVTRKAFANGTIKTSKPVDDFDLAVLFAVGRIMESESAIRTSHGDIFFTPEDIEAEMRDFAPELLEELEEGGD